MWKVQNFELISDICNIGLIYMVVFNFDIKHNNNNISVGTAVHAVRKTV
jgi:metal-sulfur cluster biosynthetic enzyme